MRDTNLELRDLNAELRDRKAELWDKKLQSTFLIFYFVVGKKFCEKSQNCKIQNCKQVRSRSFYLTRIAFIPQNLDYFDIKSELWGKTAELSDITAELSDSQN